MKRTIFSFILLSFLSTTSYAFTCTGNNLSALHVSRPSTSSNTLSLDASALRNPNNWTTDFGAGHYLTSNSLITCSGYSNPNQTTGDDKQSTFNAFQNSNISNVSQFNGLLQYYKIQGTSNAFLNENAYIAFWYMDNRTAPTRLFIGTENGSVDNPANPSYTQGLRFNEIRFYFTKAPTESIPLTPINIGTLTMRIKEKDTTTLVTTQEPVQIYLNVTPLTIKTCSVDSQTVTLPTLKTTDLVNVGSEAGSTNFTVTATCDPRGVSRTLTGIMSDNNQMDNTSFILKNTNTRSNIGIKIQNVELNRPIYYNTEFNFGTTSALLIKTDVKKIFRAMYYKINNNPTIAGPVKAQAMISVTYP